MTTPDVQVWVSTARNGVAYHAIAPNGFKTECGRLIRAPHSGAEVWTTVRGLIMSLAKVEDRFGSQPCRNCTGGKERVEPKVGRRWS